MKASLTVPLSGSPRQLASLRGLQQTFARVCNALAPVVQAQRCWNRVALHHLAYRSLRDQFPEVGSQMVCNAIYSVCRSARLVYQHPNSPFNVGRARAGAAMAPLPRLVFLADSPVYFDRHTLSVKGDRLSMYTLDGRVHFDLALAAPQLALFGTHRLREVVLHGGPSLDFRLVFDFEGDVPAAVGGAADAAELAQLSQWPSYLQVEAAA